MRPHSPERNDYATLLDHLERRRNGLEQAHWQAPALTIAAQAFLLRILTDRSIDSGARAVVLGAGIAACLAAVFSLLRLRSREVLYSEAIAYVFDKMGVAGDPRPEWLMKHRFPLKRSGVWNAIDRFLQGWAAKWRFLPPMHLAWSLALLAFVAADAVAYCATT